MQEGSAARRWRFARHEAALRVAALLVLALALGAFMALRFADVARHKTFWLDEGFELTQVCDRPAASMLLRGSYSCSPAPLFSSLQQATIPLRPFGLSMRVRYRAVSLVAATVTVLLLIVGLGYRLGLAPALAAFSVLAASETFLNYAAENRSYMMWLLASALLILAAGEWIVRDAGRASRATVGLVAATLMTGLAALPGCLQVAAALTACLLARRLLQGRSGTPRSACWLLLAVVLAIVALDGYYWTRSVCRNFAFAFHLDLLRTTDPWGLLRRSLVPLWPEARTIWGWLAHAAVVAGASAPLWLWRRRERLEPAERHAVALALVAVTQALVAIPVTISIARGGYFMVPRMFIFTMAARAVLAAVGVHLVVAWLRRVLSPAMRRPAAVLANVGVVLITAGSLITADALAQGVRFPLPELGAIDCAELTGSELRVVQPVTDRLELAPNFLVRLGMALDACGPVGRTPQPPRYIEALDVSDGAVPWYRVTREPPPGRQPATLCGERLVVPAP